MAMAMAMAEEEMNPNSNSVKAAEEEKKKNVEESCKEGYNLLGSPTFEKLENGRYKCLETGHEMPEKIMDSYGQSKRCRLALIDSFLSQKKPPMNMFKQDPLCRSKVICKLTGVIVNKSEEHIWKHLNGRKFLNKLEQKETGKLVSRGTKTEMGEDKPISESKTQDNGVKKEKKKGKKKESKKDRKKRIEKELQIEMVTNDDKSDSEPKDDKSDSEPKDDKSELEEPDFWIPPVGSRWDHDDGKDRWGSDSDSGEEEYDEGDELGASDDNELSGASEDNELSGASEGNELSGASEDNDVESAELSTRTKRMSIEIGPSSFASRKKKSKTNSTDPSSD